MDYTMNKFELFWTFIATLLLLCLLSFTCFVAYIYWDTAMTLRECAISLKNNQERQLIPVNLNHVEENQWLEIMDNAEEVT